MSFTFGKVILNNWKGMAKALAVVAVLLVGYHYVSKLFTHDTVTVVHTVYDTTQVAALTQQLALKDAEIEADTLALGQFQSMVADVQASKDSAIAFYEKTIYDLQHASPGTIIIPSATASKVFTSTVAGKEYQDTVKVTYHYPPLNSFDVDLLLAARVIVTTHTDTSTITTVHSALPDIYAGLTFVDQSIFAQGDMVLGRLKFSAGYRLGSFNYTPLNGPLANVLIGVAYKIF